jgi:ActR/RegA family two-component response regulator
LDKQFSALIVDDQQNWRELLGELLEKEFEVSFASDYDEAIERLNEMFPPFHLVVTDIRLDDSEKNNEDGIRLLSSLNRDQQFTKTIVITGYPSIATVKKAFSDPGNAFEYLEKVPANQKGFDGEGFVNIARNAARLADQERPGSFTQPDWNILLIEPDEEWRSKLANFLSKNYFQVDELGSLTGLTHTLQSRDEPYGLIFVRDALINGNDSFYLEVRHYQPESKVVVLTEQRIGDILRKLQEGLVYSAVTLEEKTDFLKGILQMVRDAYRPARTKFVLPSFSGVSPSQEVHPGQTFFIELEIQDQWSPGAIDIRFSPQPGRHGVTRLNVFTYAPGYKLVSVSERYWEIPRNGARKPFQIELIPEQPGERKVCIDLDQDNRWLGRVEVELKITA